MERDQLADWMQWEKILATVFTDENTLQGYIPDRSVFFFIYMFIKWLMDESPQPLWLLYSVFHTAQQTGSKDRVLPDVVLFVNCECFSAWLGFRGVPSLFCRPRVPHPCASAGAWWRERRRMRDSVGATETRQERAKWARRGRVIPALQLASPGAGAGARSIQYYVVVLSGHTLANELRPSKALLLLANMHLVKAKKLLLVANELQKPLNVLPGKKGFLEKWQE